MPTKRSMANWWSGLAIYCWDVNGIRYKREFLEVNLMSLPRLFPASPFDERIIFWDDGSSTGAFGPTRNLVFFAAARAKFLMLRFTRALRSKGRLGNSVREP